MSTNINRVVFAFAGGVVLLSVLRGHSVSPWWLLLAVFVGANLLQSAFTGFCPLAKILSWMDLKPGCALRS